MSARAALRRRCRELRSALGPEVRAAASQAIVGQLCASPCFHAARSIALYWPVGDEVDLLGLLPQAARAGKSCLLPYMRGDRTLAFLPYREGAAVLANDFGIPEPACPPVGAVAPGQLDLVCLPLLGFDRSGNRLGQGGGYYDRSFAFARAQAAARPLLVGVGFACQELAAIAAEPWDVPLAAVVTEREFIDCRALA